MKTLTLNYYQDAGHGWVKIKLSMLQKLGIIDQISRYSYTRKDNAYLEEDCDLGRLYGALDKAGITLKLKEFIAREKRSKIRSYDSFKGVSLCA
jgi:hypothetical protein